MTEFVVYLAALLAVIVPIFVMSVIDWNRVRARFRNQWDRWVAAVFRCIAR